MQASTEKVLKRNSGIGDAKRGLKQVANIHHSALLHPYFTLMCYIGINMLYCPVAHQHEVGMCKCTVMDVSNLFQSCFGDP